MEQAKVALFDLDGVFVTTNSTFAFVEFYAFRHFRSLKFLKFLLTHILYFVGSGWFVTRDKRDVWLEFLAGEDAGKVREAAETFVKKKLSPAVDEGMARRFADLRGKGYRIAIVSASIDPVVGAFSAAFGFDDWFSGELFVEGGKHKGFFKNDLRGRKHAILASLEKRYGSIDLADSYFFTDNREDLPLAKIVGHSYGVVRGNFENLFWEENGISVVPAGISRKISPKRFLIPLTYFLFVRTASLTDKGLWFFFVGYPMFVLLVSGVISTANVFFIILSIAGFYSIYEIGYFVNDFKSVHREKNPTIRFDVNAPISSFWFIVNRLAFFAVVFVLLWYVYPHLFFLYCYVVANAATAAIFAVHNLLRGKQRLLTFPILKAAYLFVPIILFSGVDFLAVAVSILLVYLPGNVFIYFRKVSDRAAPSRLEMIRFIVVPTCILVAVFLVLGISRTLPWSYFFLSAWLFAGHFVKIVKLARGVQS